MIRPKCFFCDRQEPPVERLGLRVTALIFIDQCQIVQRRAEIGIVGP